MKHRIAIAGIALVGLMTLTGCKFTEPYRDAPVGARNEGPADIITMPDGFSNIASKCDGPNRVYVIYHGNRAYGTVAVAPNDPRCK